MLTGSTVTMLAILAFATAVLVATLSSGAALSSAIPGMINKGIVFHIDLLEMLISANFNYTIIF